MTVGADDQEYKFRLVLANGRDDMSAEGVEIGCVGRAPVQGNIQVIALATPITTVGRVARARIESAVKTVHRRREDRFLVKKRFRPVAMVSVKVDNRDAPIAVLALQATNGDDQIIEWTEARGPITSGVMKTARRVECPAKSAARHESCREERSPHRERRSSPDTIPRGRVTVVEETSTALIRLANVRQVFRRVDKE